MKHHLLLLILVLVLNGATVYLFSGDAAAIEAAKQTSVRQIEASLPDKPFEKWLHDLLGSQAVIVWEANDCGEQTGNPSLNKDRDFPVCAGAEALLDDGRKLYISLAVGTSKSGIRTGPATFFSAVIVDPDGSQHWISELADIADAIK